jgi:hypothetical protein
MFPFPPTSTHLPHPSSNIKPSSIETINTNHRPSNDKESSLGKSKISFIKKSMNY